MMKDSELNKLPLKNMRKLKLRFSDKLEMLGFAYASILSCFAGNLTSQQPAILNNPNFEYYQKLLFRHLTIFNAII